ncbi:MAG: toll/interleukin-1 receptor domain-containing protein [Candidatus Zixiibacteriota bacterium]
MTAIVKVKLGDLFDGPSDLIVLPCSTGGTVTGFVGSRLSAHSLPHPKAGMKLGEIEIVPFEGGENLAQFVAFAASVQAHSSALSAIKSIAEGLGEFTVQEPSVRAISVPLLGAGAGGLGPESVIEALQRGFRRTAEEDAVLSIFILHPDLFARYRNFKRSPKTRAKSPVRVFISHTSTTPDAIEWVKELALHLIDSGIQARLDKFHLRRGMDLPQWMCNELAMAQKVIVVCDENYKLKADGRMGGVGWETMIIQGDIANLPHDSTKYQVIVRAEDLASGLPLYLRTRYAYHLKPGESDSSIRNELVREILELPPDERLEPQEYTI